MPLELVDDIGLFEEENNEVSPKSKLIDDAGVYKGTPNKLGLVDDAGVFGKLTPSMQKAPWIARHPNLYGIYGATKAIAESIGKVGHLKYADPYEIKKLLSLTPEQQRRQLLMDTLEDVTALAFGMAKPKPLKIPKQTQNIAKEVEIKKLASAKVVEKVGSSKPKDILAYYQKKYPALKDVKIGGLKSTKESGKLVDEGVTKIKDGKMTIYLTEDASPITVRHEIEHLLDFIHKQPTVGKQKFARFEHEKFAEEYLLKKAIPKTKVLRNVEEEEIVKGAIEKAIANPNDPIVLDETKRAFQKIAHLTQTEQIEPGMMQEIVNRYAETPEQLAKEILKAGTYSGRTLNYFSQFSKAMLRAFPKNEEVKNLLGKIANRPRSAWEWFMDKYKAVDNPRRMLMVSQLATASRNAASQGIRYTLDIFDKAVLGTMKALGGEHPAKAYAEAFSDITALFGRISPTRRKALEAILKKYPIEKAKMFSAPVHDIALGNKVSRFFMALNRGQEYFFRRMAFDAKLTALCKKAGIDKIKATPKMIEEATKHALKLTYAATPESVPGKAIMALYQKVPILTTVQPYPRFWLNAMQFLWEFNPTGYIDTAIHLAQKNPEKAVRAASKALVGSALLATAFAARTSRYAGERYYEWKIGTDPKTGNAKYYDLRAYAPFSTYLYIAEQILHPERIRPYDRIQALIGINRIAGSGLVLIDVLRNKKQETALKLIKEFAGQWLGGYTVPFRTIKDFWSTVEKREAEVQYTREKPTLGPLISNLPYSYKVLPQAPRLTREEGYKREEPAKRQITGLTVKTKTPFEQEIDRLGIENLWPRTGNAKLDRMVLGRMKRQATFW